LLQTSTQGGALLALAEIAREAHRTELAARGAVLAVGLEIDAARCCTAAAAVLRVVREIPTSIRRYRHPSHDKH